MQSPILAYNLTRPYPYRWYSTAIFTILFIALVLFSLFTVPTAGYAVKTVYTTDLNGTEAQRYWFSPLPWSSQGARCEPQNLSPGLEFFTSNYGFTYTLLHIYPNVSESSGSPLDKAASFAYRNGPLTDCQVATIELNLGRTDFNPPNDSYWWSWDDSFTNAIVNCTVHADPSPVKASFLVNFREGPRQFDYIVRPNVQKSSSIWWGIRIMDLYWSGLKQVMSETQHAPILSNQTRSNTPIWSRGQITFDLGDPSQILGPGLFRLRYHFTPLTGYIENYVYRNQSRMYNNATLATSATFTQALSFARAFYSLLLVDLGRKDLPNILLNETLLQWQLDASNDIFRATNTSASPSLPAVWDSNVCQDCRNYFQIQAPVTKDLVSMNQSYAAFRNDLGPLETFDATIFSQYSCSIPVQKDGGLLVLGVFLADVVLLEVLWRVIMFVSGLLVRRRDLRADFCRGCLDQHSTLADVEHAHPRKEIQGSAKEAVSSTDLDGSKIFFMPPPDQMSERYYVT